MSELSRKEIRKLMKEEYQKALRAKKPVTAISLAKKYKIPEGTVRRWKSSDKWDVLGEQSKKKQSERSPERSDKNANVHSDQDGHDWEELRTEFITGKWRTLKKFAEYKEIPYNGRFREKAKGWLQEKRTKARQKQDKIISQTIDKTVSKVSDDLSDIAATTAKDLAELAVERNKTHLEINAKLQDAMNEALGELRMHAVKQTTKTRKEQKKTIKPPKDKKNKDNKDKNKKGKVVDINKNKKEDPIVETEIKIIEEETVEEIKIDESIISVKKLLGIQKALKDAQQIDRLALGMDDSANKPERETSKDKVRQKPQRLKDLMKSKNNLT